MCRRESKEHRSKAGFCCAELEEEFHPRKPDRTKYKQRWKQHHSVDLNLDLTLAESLFPLLSQSGKQSTKRREFATWIPCMSSEKKPTSFWTWYEVKRSVLLEEEKQLEKCSEFYVFLFSWEVSSWRWLASQKRQTCGNVLVSVRNWWNRL